MQSASSAFKSLEKDLLKHIHKTVNEFADDLHSTSPVDTGDFFGSWSEEQTGKASYRIWNDATSENGFQYSAILALGRRMGRNGVIQGSLQWSQGLNPMMTKLKHDLGDFNG